jgi:hypothetical protein
MLATMGRIALASDPGLLSEDILEPSILSMFPSDLLNCLTPHCPLLAAFSCALQGTDPVMLGSVFAISSHMFFPTGY